MTEIVLDASVVLKWFNPTAEPGAAEALGHRQRYERGAISVTVPSLLFLEILNIAGRRWHWGEEALLELASALDDLGFDVGEAELDAIAEWVGRGLTAYDAAYVALAAARSCDLITDDAQILAAAPSIASSLIDHP